MKTERKASFTVEAVFVVSLVVFILMGCLKETIELYQQTGERAQVSWVTVEGVDTRFRGLQLARSLGNED